MVTAGLALALPDWVAGLVAEDTTKACATARNTSATGDGPAGVFEEVSEWLPGAGSFATGAVAGCVGLGLVLVPVLPGVGLSDDFLL